MRSADDEHELPVQTYGYFADRDPLTRAVMDRMLAGVSTRKFVAVGEPVGSEVEQSSSATSKTSVSEMFIERTRSALGELMSRRLDDVRLAVMMLRGLDPGQAILFVIDGGKALRKAIKDVFGEHALVHRCHRHKERNVTDLLPERDRDTVRARMRAAWSLTDPELARQRLELLAGELERTWPDAAGSLREGMHDTLTLTRLGITGQLAKTP